MRDCLSQRRCDGLVAQASLDKARSRSYQGLVDRQLRACTFTPCYWWMIPELGVLVRRHVEPGFGVRIVIEWTAPAMLYRYGVGVGFVPHHDEVTAVELRRATTNGQPVIGGDLTIVVFLNDPDEYDGGELFFPHLNLSFKPLVGSAVIFPATREFVHGVAPITAGDRYTCVARCFVQNV